MTSHGISSVEKNIIQNKYKLIGLLGKGQFGTVCKGVILKTGEQVAIKMEPSNTQVISQSHESKVLRHLNNHKVQQIPQVHYYGLQDKYVCLVMSYYEEKSLDCYELEIAHIYDWWQQACSVLRAIHDQGVVHRDIKPGHFIKTTIQCEDGNEEVRWHLIDFGLATTYLDEYNRHIKEISEPKTTLTGSPNWISPYIHQGEEPVRRDDYISLVYILLDLCLQTIQEDLPWKDQIPGFSLIESPYNEQCNNINHGIFFGL